jgi:hypothetical protein
MSEAVFEEITFDTPKSLFLKDFGVYKVAIS